MITLYKSETFWLQTTRHAYYTDNLKGYSCSFQFQYKENHCIAGFCTNQKSVVRWVNFEHPDKIIHTYTASIESAKRLINRHLKNKSNSQNTTHP